MLSRIKLTGLTKQNPQGCPTLWANDDILMFGPNKQPCTLLIPVWLTIGSIGCLFRVLAVIGHWGAWLARRNNEYIKMRDTPSLKTKFDKRIPIVPILSSLATIFEILLFVLASTDTISSRDGTSVILAMLWFFPQQFMNQFLALKFIRLGNRICPSVVKSSQQQTQIVTSYGTGFNLDDHFKNLTYADRLQQFLFIVWIIGNMGMFVSSIVTATIQSKADAFRAFFSSGIVLNTATSASQMHQMSRVIQAIQKHMAAMIPINSNIRNDVGRAVQTLKKQRLVLFLFQFPMICIVFYVVITLNADWYILLIYMYMEIIVFIFMGLSLKRKRQQAQTVTSSSGEGASPISNDKKEDPQIQT